MFEEPSTSNASLKVIPLKSDQVKGKRADRGFSVHSTHRGERTEAYIININTSANGTGMDSYPKDVDLNRRSLEVSTQLWDEQYPVKTEYFDQERGSRLLRP